MKLFNAISDLSIDALPNRGFAITKFGLAPSDAFNQHRRGWRLATRLLVAASLYVSIAVSLPAFAEIVTPLGGKVVVTCPARFAECQIALNYTGALGVDIPGTNRFSTLNPPQPPASAADTSETFAGIPDVMPGTGTVVIDVRIKNEMFHVIPTLASTRGAGSDLSIEAVAFDPAGNVFFLQNIFGRLGNGVTVMVPTFFADTNGDGIVGGEDLLYSLLDLNLYLNSVLNFALGDTFDIINGTAVGLQGVMFSTTPFSFDPNSGFNIGTPFNGLGVANSFNEISAIPEPSSLALLGASLIALWVSAMGGRGGLRSRAGR